VASNLVAALQSRFANSLDQLKLNSIARLTSARTVNSNDLKDYVRKGWTLTAPGCINLAHHNFNTFRMTVLNLVLKPAEHFCISQRLTRSLKIQPAKPESSFRRSKTTPKNVIEGIEISSPLESGDQMSRNLIPKTFQRIEARAVNFNNGFQHLGRTN
jgi:hypothetical protein